MLSTGRVRRERETVGGSFNREKINKGNVVEEDERLKSRSVESVANILYRGLEITLSRTACVNWV